MTEETMLKPNHPAMRAWLAFKESEAFRNAKHWAGSPDHADGALWAVFHAGFAAAEPKP